MASGGDHQCVAAHQGQGQLAKNLAGHLAFLQSLASRQACGQLLHLAHCSRVKAAKCFHREGQENRPWRRQASAVSLVFLWQALEREAPGSLAASATLEGQRGPVTVTSIATSFPFAQRRIVTSPGRAMVPGKRCFSSLLGPKSALAAVSNKTSLIILCLAIRSEVVRQPRE